MKERNTRTEQDVLSEALFKLRQKLKDKEKRKTGRTPVICTDESIREMVRLMPQKPTDFYSIPGVGPAFVEQYAERFLVLLNKHNDTANPAKITQKTEEILRELSKKLININRSNRMLYLPRLAAKYAVDLFDAKGRYNPLDLLFEGAKSMTVAQWSDSNSTRTQTSKERFRALTNLMREVSRDQRDKGLNDLYIGYPFAEGCLKDADFSVRAPLCLFPVVLEKSGNDINITPDTTRDILYNATLILANSKFGGSMQPLPDCTVEDSNPDHFLQDLLDFYAKNDLPIEYDSNELKKFAEYHGDSFPRYERGSIKLVHNIVIGKFPAYSSSIQRDFEGLLNKGLINRLVVDLISEYGSTDFYSDAENAELELNAPNKKLDISEHSLTYINALNSSQEAVLTAMKTRDELVVEGPPGTGKSQTITSLITQFIHEGKTVLMVSEKKTALDVVYSRLGLLSHYAMILDDANNKNLFYGQLEALLGGIDASNPMQSVDLSTLSNEIDTDIATLESIATKLFTPGDFGVEPYRLYMETRPLELRDHEKIRTSRSIRDLFSKELLSLKYDELSGIHKKFANGQLTASLDLYQLTIEHYPWFLKMKETLTNYDLILFADAIDELILQVDEWRAKPFFGRLLSKGKLKKQIWRAVKSFFRRNRGYATRIMIEQPVTVKQSLSEFTAGYANLKPVVDGLTPHEKLYLAALRKIHKVYGGKVVEWNDELYNSLLFEHIQEFESSNRTLFPQVASFDKIVNSIERAVTEKQVLSKQSVAKILSDDLRYITYSKRKGEIYRAVESRRRMSVAKFVRKFDFELFKGIKIWLMTPDAVSELLPQQPGLFDLVIFDEASQLYIERSIPSIVRAKKVVIAGDHKQLRPSSLGDGRFEISEELLDEASGMTAALEEESLLDLARFRYPDVLLNTHYRSKYEELIDFSNYAFYKGRLFVAPNTDVPKKPPIEVHLVDNARWIDRTNRREAVQVVSLIKDFFKTRNKSDTLGIIAFNVAQRDMIYDVIDEEAVKDPAFGSLVRAEMSRKDNGEDTGLFVKNIESVQGDERDVIIFSIGYAKNEAGRLMHNFGWLNQKGGENRLNVAISRAKKKIHIVTSFRPSELRLEGVKNDGPMILKKYLEYAFAVSNGNKEEAEGILRSFGVSYGFSPTAEETEYAQKVADALRKKGYEIDTQVGIGGYRIDIAVRKKGKYVLGIECDGKLYQSCASTRERDYHRQKYLQSRGWTIRRIWSMDWWRDPDGEIQKLCTLIDSL